jgi:hypothetical protein
VFDFSVLASVPSRHERGIYKDAARYNVYSMYESGCPDLSATISVAPSPIPEAWVGIVFHPLEKRIQKKTYSLIMKYQFDALCDVPSDDFIQQYVLP